MGLPDLKKRVLDLLKGTYATNGYYGLPDLGTNDSLIDDIFSEAYSAPERAEIKAWFAGRTIDVLGEYARAPATIPAVFVYRVSDVESDRANLGDRFGYGEVGETTLDHEFGVRMREDVELTIWAHTDPTMRDALYGAVKLICLRGRPFLESYSKGIDMVMWRGGRDGQGYLDNPSKAPHIIHTATARIVAETRSTWTIEINRPDELNGTSDYNEWISEG